VAPTDVIAKVLVSLTGPVWILWSDLRARVSRRTVLYVAQTQTLKKFLFD
jgi:hypothetical protein